MYYFMSISAAIVLLAVIWFVVLLVVLPIGTRTQGDQGEVTPGTPASAPVNFSPRRTVIVTTIISLIIWILSVGIILSDLIKIDDIAFYSAIEPNSLESAD